MALANQAAAVPAQGAWSGRRPCQSPFAGRGVVSNSLDELRGPLAIPDADQYRCERSNDR